MKTILTTLVASTLLSSFAFAGGGTVGSDTASRKTCAIKIEALNEKLELVKLQLQAGGASRYDVVTAQLEKNVQEFNCHTIVADKFCSETPALAREAVELANASYRDGVIDKIEVIDLQVKYADIAGYCQ